ncbi:hypothetical protein GGR54DRAFT_275181 [Hypoxylon sp. NC1633]|nr:hypothetical protein GGR54DRAFT_275181 [Hypoxylon sp. NC1633]
MEPHLEEKVAFFECLKACRFENKDDVLDADEENHRQKCRAFTSVASATPTTASHATSSTVPQRLETAPAGTASKTIPRSSEQEVEIIAVIPRSSSSDNSAVGTRGLSASASVDAETIIPETVTKQPHRPTTRSLLRARHSSRQSDPSPSTKMGKRKKEAQVKMVPEAQQIFKGLLFHYIPDNDIDPARRFRITRARAHGATWCRELARATHIIVDKKLTYADIERFLQGDPKASEKVLVNENYPIDCLQHRIIVNPDQAHYKLVGTPSPKQPENEPPPPDDSNSSLKLKPERRKAAKRTHEPTPNSDVSSQSSPDVVPSSQQPQPQTTAEAGDDELTQCINEMRASGDGDAVDDVFADDGEATGPPFSADEADAFSDSSSSNDERPRKRRAGDNNGSSRPKDLGWQEKFICMKGGTKDHADNNPNAETIKVLQKMAEVHSLAGDEFRIRAYRLAITTLRAQPKKICTAEEARALPHIGRIADKIEEIVTTNRLRQLEYALDDPRRQVLGSFLKIYGVGQAQAQKWIAQGFRTLDDLRDKAELNTNQKIGLERYDDLNTRIPRREVEALTTCVKGTAAAIDRRVELIVGGSYRRGADSSGDIDLIVTKAGTSSTSELHPFLNKLVDTLTQEGFLTAALAVPHGGPDDTDGGSKWHGCCLLPESAFPGPKDEYRPIWRRIDFLLVPEAQLGAALVYFTGNDIFNRSIRLLARKKGMKLNQRGLFSNVLRTKGNVKLTAGTLLEARDEKKIFAILGVRWREPHERWCG